MLQKLCVALSMAGLALVASADTVYKWSDSSGQVHYTDLPPKQADAKILGVYDNVAMMEEEDYGEDSGDGGDDEGGNPPSTIAPDQDEPPISRDEINQVNAEVAAARNTKCKEAQDRYQRYLESRRLFREMPDGKRQYLTDQELAEARVRAKQSVNDNCS